MKHDEREKYLSMLEDHQVILVALIRKQGGELRLNDHDLMLARRGTAVTESYDPATQERVWKINDEEG